MEELSRRGKALGHYYPCPDARVEPGRWVRSILQGFIDPRLHSDPAHGADPTRGAEWMSSSMKFCVLHVEKLHTLRGQTRLSVYTHKNAVSDPACGVEPYKFGGAQKAGQTPQSGQVICVYIEGEKGGSDPAIGALCKRSISCRAAQWVVVILPQLNSKE